MTDDTPLWSAMVEGLVALRVPREKAIARADLQYPGVAAANAARATRLAGIAEKGEQNEIRKLVLACGCKFYNLSQARKAKQTPGLADCWITHEARGLAFWWETKRQIGGEHSTAQEEFAKECAAAGVLYGTGDRYHARDFLIAQGFTPPVISR